MIIRTPHTLHNDKLHRRTRVAHVHLPRRKYWYIISVINGERFIASVPGDHQNEMDARRAASELANKSEDLRHTPWAVISSPYRDVSHVMATLKHPIWINTGSIAEVKQRMRHKL